MLILKFENMTESEKAKLNEYLNCMDHFTVNIKKTIGIGK